MQTYYLCVSGLFSYNHRIIKVVKDLQDHQNHHVQPSAEYHHSH